MANCRNGHDDDRGLNTDNAFGRETAMPAILHLNLHREYFAQIANGTKRIEYRDRTPYWKRRLEGRTYHLIHFRNGYATPSHQIVSPTRRAGALAEEEAPEMLVQFRGIRKYGTARKGKYAIRLGKIMRIRRWAEQGK